MSVVYGDRGLATLEVWKHMLKIEREVRSSLLRDFGIKSRAREPDFYSKVYKMEPKDGAAFEFLCDKYGLISAVDEYPQWMVEDYRHALLSIIRNIKQNIRAANDIYPYYRFEYEERRKHQNLAIGGCGQLYDEFTSIKESPLPVKAATFMRYTEMIEHEADLLKGWRKSDNHMMREIRKREENEKKTSFERQLKDRLEVCEKLKVSTAYAEGIGQ